MLSLYVRSLNCFLGFAVANFALAGLSDRTTAAEAADMTCHQAMALGVLCAVYWMDSQRAATRPPAGTGEGEVR